MTSARRLVDAAFDCGGCSAGQVEGDRRKDLFNLGWRPLGVVNTKWFNPSSTYYVNDSAIDAVPDFEWANVLQRTGAQSVGEGLDTPWGKAASEEQAASWTKLAAFKQFHNLLWELKKLGVPNGDLTLYPYSILPSSANITHVTEIIDSAKRRYGQAVGDVLEKATSYPYNLTTWVEKNYGLPEFRTLLSQDFLSWLEVEISLSSSE